MTFYLLKMRVNLASKSNKQKNLENPENYVVVIRESEVRIRGSGSVPKCHGFATQYKRLSVVTKAQN
jgi:hypothetical protein